MSFKYLQRKYELQPGMDLPGFSFFFLIACARRHRHTCGPDFMVRIRDHLPRDAIRNKSAGIGRGGRVGGCVHAQPSATTTVCIGTVPEPFS